MTRRRFALGVALAAMLVSANVWANDPVPASVMVILASEEPGEIAPALREIPALSRPPFSAFRSMRVLSEPSVTLRRGEHQDIGLPNGRRLRLHLATRTPDGRFRMRVSINRPGETDYLPVAQIVAAPGDPFFVAGQAHEGGTLVLGVTIGER